MTKRGFTLLEVLIALFLIALMGGIVGTRVFSGLDEHRFRSAVQRLFSELKAARFSALHMQADWIVTLEQKGNQIHVHRSCPEVERSIQVNWSLPYHFFWNGKEVQSLLISFSATGNIAPSGVLELVGGSQRIKWEFPQLFQLVQPEDY